LRIRAARDTGMTDERERLREALERIDHAFGAMFVGGQWEATQERIDALNAGQDALAHDRPSAPIDPDDGLDDGDWARDILSGSSAPEAGGLCWFCKGEFVIDALIAGYDTFDEQRLACLACNERMSGNWRPDARLTEAKPETPA